MPNVERIRHQLQARLLEVRQVQELTPTVRRITLGGDLASFVSAGPDDHVKLFFAPGGEAVPVLPNFGDGPRYPEGVQAPAMRDFTPRRLDRGKDELVIDFVLHGAGPASNWAAAAKPGSVVGQGGPRGSLVVSDDFDWYLLAGDETALPSIGRRLEELPATATAIVIAEVADEREQIELRSDAQLQLTWLHRGDDGQAAGRGLEAAIRALELPSGAGFAWVAGEAEAVRPLRHHLREERGLPKEFTRVTGYWKRGSADHHDPPEA